MRQTYLTSPIFFQCIEADLCVSLSLYIYISPRVSWKIHGMKYLYDNVISSVDDIFTNAIQALQHRWKKYVDRKGYYVEK